MTVHAAWSLTAFLGLASPALAQDCRLALVMALDVSSSVDGSEDRLQRQELAQTLRIPEVVRAFMAGDPMAFYAFEWSGQGSQEPILPGWKLVASEGDLARVAALVAQGHGPADLPHRRTALGAALGHAAATLAEAPDCRARTVDVSGDRENNEGYRPQVAYAFHPFDGVTVNALVVGRHVAEDEDDDSGAKHWLRHRSDSRLVRSFEREVLHGPDAFLILADGYEDHERAVTAKLVRELELPATSVWPLGGDAG